MNIFVSNMFVKVMKNDIHVNIFGNQCFLSKRISEVNKNHTCICDGIYENITQSFLIQYTRSKLGY
jgi:hypothetical protein